MSESGHISEPLEVLCTSFERHTDRRPDHDALMRDMSVALDTVAEDPAGAYDDRNELIDKLVGHFDTQQSNPICTQTLKAITTVGELAIDTNANRQQRWGAVAFLGLLAMSSRIQDAADSERVNPQEARQQLISLTARDLLTRITLRAEDTAPDLDTQQADLAAELLKHSDMHPDHVGADIMGLELQAKNEVSQAEIESDSLEDPQEEIITGVFFGEPVPAILDLSDPDITEKLSEMDWIKDGFDFRNPLDSYPVYHDGQLIATLYDLTVGNNKFEGIFEKLKNHQQAPNFWNNLAAAIANVVQRHAGETLSGAKAAPAYTAKRNGSNDRVTRAYFTPLGSSEDGTRRFGLMAAHRTKQYQSQILRLITTIPQVRLD